MNAPITIITDFKENEAISRIIYENLKNLMRQSLAIMKQNLLSFMQKMIPLRFLVVLKEIYLVRYVEYLPFGLTKNIVVKDSVENYL